MKKLLITISPICVILFILIWISCGFDGVLMSFGTTLFIIFVMVLFAKWIDFVDKHIKD